MKVIFLKHIPKIGKMHEIKEVNDGYALNFLFPRKLAILATEEKVNELKTKQKELLVGKQIETNLLQKNLEEIQDKTIVLKEKANEKGHLFSAIHKEEILNEMQKQNHTVIDKDFIFLEKPIKEIGEFQIEIRIPSSFKIDKKYFFKLKIEAK